MVRKEFEFLWKSPCNRKIIVAARSSGKTYSVLQYTLETLLKAEKKNNRAVFFSGTVKQSELTVSPILRELTKDFPSGSYSYNAQKNLYRFNLADDDIRELLLLSYENEDRKRGLHPNIIVLDECELMPYSMFGAVILPMLSDPTGILIGIGTPQGPNKFFDLFKMGMSEEFPDWESYMIKASKCNIFEPKFLLAQQQNLTAAEYAQEYECDFFANVLVGSVYGEFIRKFVEKNNRISDSYMWDPNLPVYTAWDLGYADYTAIWFFQKKNDQITFIDYFEDNGHDITYYINILNKKPYNYSKLILPHDGGHNNIRGSSIEKQLRDMQFSPVVLSPRPEHEGIDEARKLLKTCAFNSFNCHIGLDHLRNFKYKIDKKTGLKLNITEHDESSHCADAFRYVAMSRDVWGRQQNNGKIISTSDYNVLY